MKTGSDSHPKSVVSRRSFSVPKYITRLMTLLQFIHWRLAFAVAIKLFYTPIKFPIPKREISARDSAHKVIIPLGGREAVLFHWGSGDKKVLLIHGWSGRATQFFRLIEKLVEEGFHVYSIEGPAHGDSLYKRTDMLEIINAILWAHANHGPFQAGIGHSLGGAAILNAHARLEGAFQYVITIGCPANIRSVIDDFCKTLKLNDRIADEFENSIERRFSLKISEASADTLAAAWNPKGIIFQDTTDADVDVSQAYQLSKSWAAAELVISNGLGHRRIISDPQVHDRILELIRD